jgi:hypothetical protein
VIGRIVKKLKHIYDLGLAFNGRVVMLSVEIESTALEEEPESDFGLAQLSGHCVWRNPLKEQWHRIRIAPGGSENILREDSQASYETNLREQPPKATRRYGLYYGKSPLQLLIV